MQRKVSCLSLFILCQITMLLCLLTTRFREKQGTITQLYNLSFIVISSKHISGKLVEDLVAVRKDIFRHGSHVQERHSCD